MFPIKNYSCPVVLYSSSIFKEVKVRELKFGLETTLQLEPSLPSEISSILIPGVTQLTKEAEY